MTAVGDSWPDGTDRTDGTDGTDRMDGTGGPGAEDERELRILLQRAVPRLPAPEGRLREVRERVARNRRRRRTAGAAATVTGLALAGTLLPGVLRAGEESTPPAASAPSVTAAPPTRPPATGPSLAPVPDSSSPSAGDEQAQRTRFAHVAGLLLRLPDTWQALDVPEDARYKQPARGFVSTQRFVPYEQSCSGEDRSLCLPVQALRPGGALLTLVAHQGAGLSAKAEDPPVLYPSDSPSPACREVMGTQEFTGLIGGAPAPDSAVIVTLCVAGDAPGTVEGARAMVTGADFGRGPVTDPSDLTASVTTAHPQNAT
ncbi:hypothetical protein [Streptomyces sp. L-9-10]|uniref:hypothetical protein n=1 Tax=Streptomyces sp. L-9-10 TaxID=1478131 RepID=UPI00101BA900|nr:hypothetical protein [Streptomyces sp. L-9-10]